MDEKQSLDETHVDALLMQMMQRQAHELHLKAGREPCVRRDGEEAMHELDEYERCQPQQIQAMVYDIISDEQIQHFENDLKLVFTHLIRGPGVLPSDVRFIIVAEWLNGSVAASLRRVAG